MGNSSETGRASKLSAFGNLKNFLGDLQPPYNPPADNLKVDFLNQVQDRATQAHQVVSTTDAAYRVALNKRNVAVKPLNGTVRSIVDLVAALNLANGHLPKVKSLAKSITGNSKLSQQGFEARIDHFNQFIDLIRNLDGYTAGRDHLQIANLETLLESMKDTSKDLALKESTLNAVRLQRNAAFSAEDGLVATTRRVKLYLKSLLGHNSEAYKQVVRITKVLYK